MALPVSVAGFNGFGALLLLVTLWAHFSEGGLPWEKADAPFTRALWIYLAVAVVVSTTAVVPRVSFSQLNKDLHKPCLAVLMLVWLRLADRRRAAQGLAAGAALAAVVGVGQALFLRRSDGISWERAHAFSHPVTFGVLMCLFWLGAVCAYLRSGPGRERKAFAAGIALLGAALVLSQTRTAFIGAAAGLLALGLSSRKYRKLALLGLLLAPAALLVAELLPGDHNLTSAFSARYTSKAVNPFFARLTFWKVGWEAFKEHPLFGVGPGNYRVVFDRYFTGVIEGQSVWGSAHNLYVHQAAERGLLGLAALSGVLGAMTLRAWRRVQGDYDAANLWAWSSCAAFLVMNLFENAFQTEQAASLMIVIWCFAEARP